MTDEQRRFRTIKLINTIGFCIDRGAFHRAQVAVCQIGQFLDPSQGDNPLYPYTTWNGSSQGEDFLAELCEKILPAFKGSAELVVFWNDGTESGIRVRDGKVSLHAVGIALADEPLAETLAAEQAEGAPTVGS
jgi:hypothetical protein